MNKGLFFCFIVCSFSAFAPLLHADQDLEELRQRVVATAAMIQGWCSQEKASVFFDLIVRTKPKVCVDIGTYAGASLFPVAAALKYLGEGVVIGIDAWDRDECIKYFDPESDAPHLEWWSKTNILAAYYQFLNLIRQHELEAHCITMKTTSERAASVLGAIDFLYIDGNHCIAAKDVELFLPKVVKGGHICLNDVLWPQMEKALKLLLDSCDIACRFDRGNAILFQKR